MHQWRTNIGVDNYITALIPRFLAEPSACKGIGEFSSNYASDRTEKAGRVMYMYVTYNKADQGLAFSREYYIDTILLFSLSKNPLNIYVFLVQ